MFDEDGRKIDLGQQVGMNLEGMGGAELQDYIASLKAEIVRVEVEIERKNASNVAADAFFK